MNVNRIYKEIEWARIFGFVYLGDVSMNSNHN